VVLTTVTDFTLLLLLLSLLNRADKMQQRLHS